MDFRAVEFHARAVTASSFDLWAHCETTAKETEELQLDFFSELHYLSDGCTEVQEEFPFNLVC